ncbi:MAG: InlB B-repeat-containing protein [Burkholderiaceae bacterium]
MTFNSTQGSGTWTVPAGVTQIDIEAVGGAGGNGMSAPSGRQSVGGSGARVRLTGVTVVPNTVLAYSIGRAGGNTFYFNYFNYLISGGGGGSTQLGPQGGQPWLIAGGGGGGAFLGGAAVAGGGAGGSGCGAATGGAGAEGEPSQNASGTYVGGGGGSGGAAGVGGVGGAGNLSGNAGGDGFGGSGGSSYGRTSNGGASSGPGVGGVGVSSGSSWWGSGGGGGGYGGGGSGGRTDRTDQGDQYAGIAGGGAGGSLWPGMTSSTPNSPTCMPSGNGSEPLLDNRHGYLKISWVDYSLNFAGNGSDGGSAPASVSAAEGVAVTLPANSFTRSLHGFSGWNTAADGSGSGYAAGDSFTMPGADTTLYAQWVVTDFAGPTVPSTGASGTGTFNFTTSDGGPGCGLDLAETAFVAAPPGQNMPQGMFKFRLTGCTPGFTARVTVTWPQPIAGRYVKWGKASAGATQSSAFAPANLSVSGRSASFDVTDGAQGDDDWTSDGTLTDPSGTLAEELQGVPTLGELALALLALVAGGLGVRGLRRPAVHADRACS